MRLTDLSSVPPTPTYDPNDPPEDALITEWECAVLWARAFCSVFPFIEYRRLIRYMSAVVFGQDRAHDPDAQRKTCDLLTALLNDYENTGLLTRRGHNGRVVLAVDPKDAAMLRAAIDDEEADDG